MKVVLHDDFGGEHDVTEKVKDLYGWVVGSMDWGSGFLSTEEEIDILEIGVMLGTAGDLVETKLESEKLKINHYERSIADVDPKMAKRNADIHAKFIARHQTFIKKLSELKDSREKLLALTEDVTGFDEEKTSN